VLTSTGKYYWIPLEAVELAEFRPPERPRDLLWRPTHMVVTDGPDGEVFLPTIYPLTFANGDDQLRLGRGTDWRVSSLIIVIQSPQMNQCELIVIAFLVLQS
ncbi:MAG: type VI secretion system accessory protein TagJ, partial [Coriobacteriia bacterium]